MVNRETLVSTKLTEALNLNEGDYILEPVDLEYEFKTFYRVNSDNFIKGDYVRGYDLLKVISVYLTEWDYDTEKYEGGDDFPAVILRVETLDKQIRRIETSTSELFTVVKGM